MTDVYELIRLLEERIEKLPKGYISKKNINGKVQHYLQWKENGKVRSKYIRDEELEELVNQIAERKKLQSRLKEKKAKYMSKSKKNTKHETNVTT